MTEPTENYSSDNYAHGAQKPTSKLYRVRQIKGFSPEQLEWTANIENQINILYRKTRALQYQLENTDADVDSLWERTKDLENSNATRTVRES